MCGGVYRFSFPSQRRVPQVNLLSRCGGLQRMIILLYRPSLKDSVDWFFLNDNFIVYFPSG